MPSCHPAPKRLIKQRLSIEIISYLIKSCFNKFNAEII